MRNLVDLSPDKIHFLISVQTENRLALVYNITQFSRKTGGTVYGIRCCFTICLENNLLEAL